MSSIDCAVSSIECAVSSIECAVSSLECAVSIIECAVSSIECTVSSIECTVSSIECTVSSIECTVYSIECAVSSIGCAVSSVDCAISLHLAAVLSNPSCRGPVTSSKRTCQTLQWVLYTTSRFIWPCKSWTDACFGITQFVTPNTQVLRHFGVYSRRKNIYI